MSETEMLRRLRSGMNAMFDAAGADAVVVDHPLPVKALESLREPGVILTMEPARPLKLDDSPGYRRISALDDEAFTEEDIAYMTGGAR